MTDDTFLDQFVRGYLWPTAPAKRLFRFKKQINKGMLEDSRLALTLGGVIDRSIDDDEGLQSSDYSAYQIFERDDLVFKLIDLENIKTSRVGYVPRRGIMSPAYIRLQPSSRAMVSKYYFWFFYGAYLNNIFNGLGGGVRQNLTPTDLLTFPVPLPDFDTQAAIADFLDKETDRIESLIAKKRYLVTLLKEREGNNVAEAIGHLETTSRMWKVSHVCILRRGRFNHRPRNAPELYDGDHPFLQTGDVAQARKYITTFKQTLSDLGAGVSAQFPANSVLMAIAANVGDVAITKFEAYCPDSVVGFIPTKKLTAEYVYYALRSLRASIATSSTSNAQDNTNIARLGALKIAVPDEDTQRKVSKTLSSAEKTFYASVEAIEKSIDCLREFRSSLITAAVIGQIDVRTWGQEGTADRRLDQIQEAMRA